MGVEPTEEVYDALLSTDKDYAVRAVIITGVGKALLEKRPMTPKKLMWVVPREFEELM